MEGNDPPTHADGPITVARTSNESPEKSLILGRRTPRRKDTSRAEALVHARSLSAEFFEVLDHSAEILLLERERGTLEVYSRHASVLNRLSRLVSVSVVESEHWQQSGG